MRTARELRRAAHPAAAAPAVAPSPRLAVLLNELRRALTRYVGGRRAAGAPLERVLVEVHDLATAAAACEGWHDRTGLLVSQATRWTCDAFAAGRAPADDRARA